MPQAREKVLFQIGSIPGVPGTGKKKDYGTQKIMHTLTLVYVRWLV